MKKPINVAITGAAGNIAYSTIFRVASGQMLGNDQPVSLKLIDIEPAMNALKGVMYEVEDCAFPLLNSIKITYDLNQGFEDCDYALLIGAKPRVKGMERKDLLKDNGKITGYIPCGVCYKCQELKQAKKTAADAVYRLQEGEKYFSRILQDMD